MRLLLALVVPVQCESDSVCQDQAVNQKVEGDTDDDVVEEAEYLVFIGSLDDCRSVLMGCALENQGHIASLGTSLDLNLLSIAVVVEARLSIIDQSLLARIVHAHSNRLIHEVRVTLPPFGRGAGHIHRLRVILLLLHVLGR